MHDQRWPGDYQTIGQEFISSRQQEEMGMMSANASHEHDYLTLGMTPRFDAYQLGELEDSWTTQLDTNGMQPHSREYLTREATSMRSAAKLRTIDGQTIDYCEGIQFSGMP